MRTVQTSALQVAQRFIGLKEVKGHLANPLILAMLQLDQQWPGDDAVPWCSAFANFVAMLLGLPRSKALHARSWLEIGEEISFAQAEPGLDVCVFSRGEGKQPGPDVMDAPGHVTFLEEVRSDGYVRCVGGNQGDQVSSSIYSVTQLLRIRRLA